MILWIATGNDGKLTEFKSLLYSTQIEVHSQKELSYYSPPPENGKTFEENARIKAKSLHAVKPGFWVLAEDSGLEVEGLQNMPGIYSARYAGEKASSSENMAKLLKMMQIRSPLKRKAQFRAVLLAISPSGEEHFFTGILSGSIALKTSGQGGFGYDPIFIPEGETQTLAELGIPYKNIHSHRAIAMKSLLAALKEVLKDP